jgi:hypothetical protein
MSRIEGRIIKSKDVEIKDRFSLEVMQGDPGAPKSPGRALVTPQVRIAEKTPDFAVIEITCSCGTKTSLRCEYADAQSAAKNPETQGSAASNETAAQPAGQTK